MVKVRFKFTYVPKDGLSFSRNEIADITEEKAENLKKRGLVQIIDEAYITKKAEKKPREPKEKLEDIVINL